MHSTTLFRCYTTDHFCAILNCLLRMEGAILACESLDDDFGVLVYKHSRLRRLSAEQTRTARKEFFCSPGPSKEPVEKKRGRNRKINRE